MTIIATASKTVEISKLYKLNAVHKVYKENSTHNGKVVWVLNYEEVEVQPQTILTTGQRCRW
jgi:fructose-specific component phosphotransferase system IIB-like protein